MTLPPTPTRPPPHIDFWFDFSCPYAYLGFTQVARVAESTGVEVRLQPFLLGGVFRSLGQPQNMSTTLNAPKKRHNRADLLRWASWFEVPLHTPLRHPNRTVLALRTLLATPREHWLAVTHALFQVYWVHGRDISDPAVIARAVADVTLDGGAKLDGQTLVRAAESSAIKAALYVQTDAAIAAGVFGAPAWVVDDQLFWGQDRIHMVIRAARDGWRVDPDRIAFQFNQETATDGQDP